MTSMLRHICLLSFLLFESWDSTAFAQLKASFSLPDGEAVTSELIDIAQIKLVQIYGREGEAYSARRAELIRPPTSQPATTQSMEKALQDSRFKHVRYQFSFVDKGGKSTKLFQFTNSIGQFPGTTSGIKPHPWPAMKIISAERRGNRIGVMFTSEDSVFANLATIDESVDAVLSDWQQAITHGITEEIASSARITGNLAAGQIAIEIQDPEYRRREMVTYIIVRDENHTSWQRSKENK